jgi:hypothetical protein
VEWVAKSPGVRLDGTLRRGAGVIRRPSSQKEFANLAPSRTGDEDPTLIDEMEV